MNSCIYNFLKFGISFLLFSSSAFASPIALKCRGQTTLATGFQVDVLLSLSNSKEGEKIELSSPITEDVEPAIQLTQQKVWKTMNGVRVLATYDRSNYSGFITFELQQRGDGSTVLADFKGFEGKASFGPSELVCENNVNSRL